ncbi:MAG: hypothetical protein R3A52_22905 [Polyangiales bacterium]
MRFAYAVNLLMLIPIAVPTLLGRGDPAQSRFAESEGWRAVVGAFWCAVMALSVYGLWRPERAAPLLVAQVIYKSLWLAVFALPRVASGRAREVPPGIGLSFLFIVLVWPWLIPWRALLA